MSPTQWRGKLYSALQWLSAYLPEVICVLVYVSAGVSKSNFCGSICVSLYLSLCALHRVYIKLPYSYRTNIFISGKKKTYKIKICICIKKDQTVHEILLQCVCRYTFCRYTLGNSVQFIFYRVVVVRKKPTITQRQPQKLDNTL